MRGYKTLENWEKQSIKKNPYYTLYALFRKKKNKFSLHNVTLPNISSSMQVQKKLMNFYLLIHFVNLLIRYRLSVFACVLEKTRLLFGIYIFWTITNKNIARQYSIDSR